MDISSRVWNGNKRTLWLWPGLPTACKEISLVQTLMEWYMVIFCFMVKGVFEHIGRPFTAYGQNKKNPCCHGWDLHFEYSDSQNLLRCLCMSLNLIYFLREEFLANSLCTLLRRKMFQRIQLYRAYPKAALWEGQKARHCDYASLKSLLVIPSCPYFECKSC